MIANLIAIGLTVALWPVIGPWALLCIVFYRVIAQIIIVPIAATGATVAVVREKLASSKEDRSERTETAGSPSIEPSLEDFYAGGGDGEDATFEGRQ